MLCSMGKIIYTFVVSVYLKQSKIVLGMTST